jgi:hypothetical protein
MEYDSQGVEYFCTHQLNLKTKDTWRNMIMRYPIKPKKMNKNNDCKWYKEKQVNVPPKKQ